MQSVLMDLMLCPCSGIQAAQPVEASERKECCRRGSNIHTPANMLKCRPNPLQDCKTPASRVPIF